MPSPAKPRRPSSKAAPVPKGKTATAKSAPVSASVSAKPKKRAGGRRLSADAIAEMFDRFHEANPKPVGELEFANPFELLVAVVLSAQATDASVNKATRGLFALADTPARMVALGEERVREHIKSIGLYRNKAKNVIALSERLLAMHGGDVPEDRTALESLPGVGRKTANVVLNVAFQHPTMAVDTHVFRLAHRIGLSAGKTPLAVEADLDRIIPPAYGVPAHHWLILHGRYVCKARKPECWRCIIRETCLFEPKTPPPVQASPGAKR
ncbi:MAG: endonuclease III [Hyphomicrobium sp.]